MDIKSLRIGNWINNHIYNMATKQFEYEPVQVDINILRILENSPDLHTYSPIPLTEDLLKKLDFVQKNDPDEWHMYINSFANLVLTFSDCSFAIYDHEKNFKTGNYFASDISGLYLHDLQNLSYALTHKEFDINFFKNDDRTKKNRK
jgi:hypothetical protein